MKKKKKLENKVSAEEEKYISILQDEEDSADDIDSNESEHKDSEEPEHDERTAVVLPQNIKWLGESDDTDKKVYVHQDVYKELHKFASTKKSVECGGVLVGTVAEAFGKMHIIISGFIEAKYSKGTATSLTFTHESWEYIHSVQEKKYPDQIMVGWIHTHPDYGIFLSDYDKFIQNNFFNEPHQIAYVIDPIQKIEGIFTNGTNELVKAKGFYLYDEAGKEISAAENEPENGAPSVNAGTANHKKDVIMFFMIVLLTAAVAFLAVNAYSSSQEINKLQKNISAMETELEKMSANDMQNFIEINALKEQQAVMSSVIGTAEAAETTATETIAETASESDVSKAPEDSVTETTADAAE